MKKNFEYNLYKKQFFLTILIYFVLFVALGIPALFCFNSETKIDQASGFAFLVGLIVEALFLFPFVLYNIYSFIKIKKVLTNYYEEYIVVLKEIDCISGRYYFTFDILLNDGRKVKLNTKNFFRTYGALNYENFINKKAKIGYASNYEFAIILEVLKD